MIAKNEIIEEKKIDVNKFIQENQEKRKQEIEDNKKRIEEQIKKEQPKKSGELSIKEIQPPETKIFRNQEVYIFNTDGQWEDELFKNKKESLCPINKKGEFIFPENTDSGDADDWEKINWAKAEEILNTKNYSIFDDGIKIDDIVQGSISNCYFLSALASLCKYPKLIENLFYTKEKTKENAYGIYFYINGQKKLVYIDDYFPCFGNNFKSFAFSKCCKNKIWVELIEKAWAKINGSYIRIGCGGTVNEVFDVLTEAYSEIVYINHKESETIWNNLINAQEK